MDKHTAQTIGKYGGKDVWIISRNHKAKLVRINFNSGYVKCEWTPECTNDFVDPALRKESFLASDIVPILKTTEDLTEDEHWECCEEFTTMAGRRSHWNRDFKKMMKVNGGALSSVFSETGYMDFWDNLPCKRYSEVFG